MCHQDNWFHVEYEKGKLNKTDFMSRQAKPWQKLPKREQDKAGDLNNLLYILYPTPVIDSIALATIVKHTKSDA